MTQSCDRDFIDAVAFMISVYRDNHIRSAGQFDPEIRLLAFVYGHDPAWVADHVHKRLQGSF